MAYIVSGFNGEQLGAFLMVAGIGAPWALGLLTIGALVGALGRKYATAGKMHYTVVIATIVFGSASFLAFKSNQNEQNRIEEERLAVDFVKQNQEVLAQVGGNPRVWLSMSSLNRSGEAIRYELSVNGEKTIRAIVDVSRQSGRPVFNLACTLTRAAGRDDPYKHPCKQ
jgi:hypothetical protein